MADSVGIRGVTLLNPLEFEFEGNILKKAICLGDVDNDGFNELIVGNDRGHISVFKAESAKAVYYMKDLGTISVIEVGDVLNIGKSTLLVITACGYLFLYDLEKQKTALSEVASPFHTQRVPANIKEVLIGDINGDGFSEVVVGLTDRVVRTYRWFNITDKEDRYTNGKLVGLYKWEFADQIGSISLVTMPNGKKSLLVAQPGGNFIMPKIDPPYGDKQDGETADEVSANYLTKYPVDFESFGSMAKCRNADVCGINYDGETEPTFIISTLDGALMLIKGKKVQWKLQVDHELFSVHCLDVTGDGNDEVVACAWDGTTFIVGKGKEHLKYSFKESVSAFTAGLFGNHKKNVPCFVYATFNNCLYVYCDVSIPSLSVTTLHDELNDNEEFKEIILNKSLPSDKESLRNLCSYVLYGVDNSL